MFECNKQLIKKALAALSLVRAQYWMRSRPDDTMLIFALYILISGVQAYKSETNNFKITSITVPNHVSADQKEVDIICEYDANFTIMSWFKGPKEFYRYRPLHVPSTMSFGTDGVGQIEQVVCGQEKCHLRLGALTPEATGLYRCDIERDVPPYKFETRTAYMQVEGHEPRTPLLTGVAPEYAYGDVIHAFCRGERDTELRWYINGKEMFKLRGSPVLQQQSHRSIFFGYEKPSIVIQCAEMKYGKLIGSNEMKAFWKETTTPEKNEAHDINKLYFIKVLIPIVVSKVYLN